MASKKKEIVPEARRLLSAQEVADSLGVSRNFIYQMANRREIPFVKIGSRKLFRPEDLDSWVSSRLIAPQTEPGACEARA